MNIEHRKDMCIAKQSGMVAIGPSAETAMLGIFNQMFPADTPKDIANRLWSRFGNGGVVSLSVVTRDGGDAA